jgi:hypothetical protein
MNLSHLSRAELERRVASQEADLVLARQDVKGCEDMFDALNVPERTPGGDRLRPTGRANVLLGRYRALYLIAKDAADELDEQPTDSEAIEQMRRRIDALAPEDP